MNSVQSELAIKCKISKEPATGGHVVKVFPVVQDLRRSNFTAADCRRCNFKNTNLQGSYFIKSVVPSANFEVGFASTRFLSFNLAWSKVSTQRMLSH